MSAKHTQGPWVVDHKGSINTGDGKCVADAWDLHIGKNKAEANARLIAAAPDGLKAAKLAYLHILKTPHDRLRTKGQNVLCALRDFIASATGRDAEEVQNEFEALAAKAKG